MTREGHLRFCESVGVRFPCATRPYIRVKGEWKYLYRAVDKDGQTIDFLLTPHRDKAAAAAFFAQGDSCVRASGKDHD
jgi:putative transposase